MVTTPSFWRLTRGTGVAPPATLDVRAGPVDAILDGIDLRNVRIGDTEFARRVYVAIRDVRWDTVPGSVSDIAVERSGDGFEVRFDVRHESNDVEFAWQGRVRGDERGRIEFSMHGRALRDMSYNRIGICVLLPCGEMAGKHVRATSPDGPWEGDFPTDIAPQRAEDGVLLALHPAASRLEFDLRDGSGLVLQFDGDLFETEDQRNWSDASFKIYSTPLRLGVPHRISAGGELAQSVVIGARGAGATPADMLTGERTVRLLAGQSTGMIFPSVGLAFGSPLPSHSDEQIARLAALRPAHLRFDCHLESATWARDLATALKTCAAVGAALELALFCRVETTGLDRLREILGAASLSRVLVFYEGATTASAEETTPAGLAAMVRRVLPPGTVVAGGTDMHFCELNRTRPEFDSLDGIAWSVNPQVHAFDDISLLETPEAQGMQVATAHRFAPSKALFVGPVTLLPRGDFHAGRATRSGASADIRQAALIGAAFTVSSLKHLAEAGVEATTYYETIGPRGVVADHGGVVADHGAVPQRAEYPESASVAPLYHPLADAASFAGLEVLSVASTAPSDVVVLGVRRHTARTFLVANTTPRHLVVELSGVGDGCTIRRLNATNVGAACKSPDPFRRSADRYLGDALYFSPYETARIDVPG